MNFICNGQDLSVAVNTVSRALQGNRNIPALEGIKIKANDSSVMLAAYCHDLYIEKSIKAEVLEDGETVINGSLFKEYSSKLSGFESIKIQKGANEIVTIKFEKSVAEIRNYEFKNFPTLGDEGGNENSFKISEKEAKELFERVIFCVAQAGNETRPILKTCNIKLTGDEVTAAGLDGFRVGISKKTVKSHSGKINVNVQGKNISEVCKILGDTEEDIKIQKINNTLIIDSGHTKIKINLVDGEFYKYENTIPKIETRIIINKAELESALTRASIISKESFSNSVKMKFFNNQINITCESEKGRCDETVNCSFEGNEILMCMNVKFLQDAIGRIKEDNFVIKAESNDRPMLITRLDGDEYRCVIMPVRMI